MIQMYHTLNCDTCITFEMKEKIRISEAEWDVMSFLWRKAPRAASEVLDEVKDRKNWTLGTVRTLLRRLVKKKALSQSKEGKRLLYTPLVSLEACARQESQSFLDRVVGQAPAATILHLVEHADLSNSEINELRKLLRKKEK